MTPPTGPPRPCEARLNGRGALLSAVILFVAALAGGASSSGVTGSVRDASALMASATMTGGALAERASPDSEASPTIASEAVDALRSDLQALLATEQHGRARWGVLAVSLEGGDTLFAVTPSEPLVPASNAKLLTTAAALAYLGAGFRYQTFLLTEADTLGGWLLGDLILYGTGDPGISRRFQDTETSVFEAFADSLVARRIHVIEGD